MNGIIYVLTSYHSWVAPTLLEIKKVLTSKKFQGTGKNGDYCAYRAAVTRVA